MKTDTKCSAFGHRLFRGVCLDCGHITGSDPRLAALANELETGTKIELGLTALEPYLTGRILGISALILRNCPDLTLAEIPGLVSNLGEDFSGVSELTAADWSPNSAILTELDQYRHD
jgi:hypothetical protein